MEKKRKTCETQRLPSRSLELQREDGFKELLQQGREGWGEFGAETEPASFLCYKRYFLFQVLVVGGFESCALITIPYRFIARGNDPEPRS